LLEGAKTVVKSFHGQLPTDPEVLVKQIEGIGPYTAGAIASIAYGVKAATVDGNVSETCILAELPSSRKS
jgi:A/G-specific adenine glycosylase